MIRVNENSGQKPSEQLMQDMGKLMDEMTREGVLIRTAGLRPTREGVRVRLRKSPAVDGRWTVYGDQGSDWRLCDLRGRVDGDQSTNRFK